MIASQDYENLYASTSIEQESCISVISFSLGSNVKQEIWSSRRLLILTNTKYKDEACQNLKYFGVLQIDVFQSFMQCLEAIAVPERRPLYETFKFGTFV